MKINLPGHALLLAIVLAQIPMAGSAAELHVASWNLEHLDDTDGAGCVGRVDQDYATLASRIEMLNADIVALQEVENEAAAQRVFPATEWNIEISNRPPRNRGSACWSRPESKFGHLATGFAIRRGISHRRNPDLQALGAGSPFQRWGTDITVTANGRELRLLSVHLKSRCWGAKQDGTEKSRTACATLRSQMERLRDWVNARRVEGTAFVILGDFNRRLNLPDDWAWKMLSPSSAPLENLTAGTPARCHSRFPEFIDHFVLGNGARTLLVPGSFREHEREGPHPDHCAISARLRLGD